MNITKEDVDVLNAVVTIKVEPADYQPKVDEALKKVQKQAAMPGFRPGKVPAGMVKKMYGKNVMADELNKLLNDTIYKYINDNKIEILGNPLPKDNHNHDFEHATEFTFTYDVGLAPHFEVELSGQMGIEYLVVKIDDALIDKYVKTMRREYGKPVNPETASERDVIFVDINELDENGDIKAGGVFKSTSIGIDRLKGETAKTKLIGAKKDDKIIIASKDLYENAVDLSVSLGIDKEIAEHLDCNLQLSIKNIGRIEDAELNEELFNKLYGEGVVKTEEEFRAKVSEELGRMFLRDSDRKFYEQAEKALIDQINPALPEAFLKRWLMAVNEKPLTLEQIEKEFDVWARTMKWKLIENKLFKKYAIQVSQEEAKEEAKRFVTSEYSRYGQTIEEAELDKLAASVLTREKEAEKIFDGIYYAKTLVLFKEKLAPANKEVSYNEFFGISE